MNKAKNFRWDEIKVGLNSSFSVLISEEMVNSFLRLSGDFNPLHADDAYAAKTIFGQRVVPGMLLSSFFSQLVGMHLPGERSLYLSQTLSFKNPTFVGDEIVVRGEVTRIFEPKKVITMATTITHTKTKKTLVEGECRVLYLPLSST